MILPPAMHPAVVVHGAGQARAALAPGRPVLLLSAFGAAGYLGALWWRSLMAHVGAPCDALDCADQPGRALEALAAGCRIVILHPCPALPSVAARAHGALILSARPPSLDLAHPGAARRLHAWLAQDDTRDDTSPSVR